MRLVNGHYCANCTEELLAKRGLDPTSGPHRAQLEQRNDERTKASGPVPTELGVNRPAAGGEVGARLNLYA